MKEGGTVPDRLLGQSGSAAGCTGTRGHQTDEDSTGLLTSGLALSFVPSVDVLMPILFQAL